MQLKEIMTQEVFTITDDIPAEEAYHRMTLFGTHHLVVVKGKAIVGVISERDLGGKKGEQITQGRTVRELMTEDVITASPETTIQEASELLLGYGVGSLPIVDPDGSLVGIVTISDLLALLSQKAGQML